MKFKSKDELTQWAAGSTCLWLFLDYDGTLADFAPSPDYVEPNLGVIDLLARLVRKPALRITILSGRRLEHVRRLVPVPGIILTGTYGIELSDAAGEVRDRVEYTEIRPFLEVIKPQWEGLIRERSGFFLEDKGWTLALHARFANDKEAEQVLIEARQIIEEKSLVSRFCILGGHKFLEIAPLLASKRETVTYLLSQYPLPDARVLYIGDDDKDEEAFPVIHAHGGAAVKVFQPSQMSFPTEADFLFDSPADTLHWLESLL